MAVARARVAEAYARQRQAELYWLPTITSGAVYDRHDGQIQDTNGNVLTVSRQSLFAGGGMNARVSTGDALFLPLVARRLTAAAAAAARATVLNIQLDVASAYLDLLSISASQAINTDTLARADEMLRLATAADRAGLNKTSADVPRAQTEVSLRKQEAIDLQALGRRIGPVGPIVASRCRGGLGPRRPSGDTDHVGSRQIVPDMIVIASANRPELAVTRALTGAAAARLRQAQLAPFLPRLDVSYLAGTFGGGIDSQMSNFGGRGDDPWPPPGN